MTIALLVGVTAAAFYAPAALGAIIAVGFLAALALTALSTLLPPR